MDHFNFSIPTQIIYGNGKISQLQHVLPVEASRVLVVTDKQVAGKSTALEKIKLMLKEKQVFIIDDIQENPSVQQVHEGASTAIDNNIQWVIGLGGGSPMDAAKGIAVMATNEGNILDYMAGNQLSQDPLPIICIPTSSGTGSEVIPYAVFTDPEKKVKGGYANPKIFPRTSIVDPELTYSMPSQVVINTGLDALTHAIEAYLSTEAFPLNDCLALHAIETVLANLTEAAQKNKEAMANMSYAATVAGIAITHGGTILLHIMAYPLTVFHGIPHGLANAILLPAFLKFMAEKSTVKDKISHLENRFKRMGKIEDFVRGFRISTHLSDYGIDPSEFELFAAKTIVKGDIKITPAPVTEEEIINIYQSTL